MSEKNLTTMDDTMGAAPEGRKIHPIPDHAHDMMRHVDRVRIFKHGFYSAISSEDFTALFEFAKEYGLESGTTLGITFGYAKGYEAGKAEERARAKEKARAKAEAKRRS